ncbi:MAG TPA: flagellar hook capping FlgD N-terminal domain-containing protein [Bryobacteraceae bacterium]|nr:flagellar hook capping FlgD N-terminal domain-containing protein [Bryobacteraceae bacterium]
MTIFGPAAVTPNSAPATGTNGTNGTNGSSSSTGSSLTSATDPLTQESTFLQLLIAQIQNQDPLNPTDSIQFVGQLVSYSQLEQLMNISNNTQQIATAAGSAAANSNSGNTNSGNTNSNTTPVSGSGTQPTQ